MEAKFLNKLYLTRNNITEIGANHLAMSLSSPTCNIKKLRLNKNWIKDEGLYKILVPLGEHMMKVNKSTPYSSIMNLDISDCKLTDGAGTSIVKFLKANPYVFKIRIGKNKINYKILKKIEDMLDVNKNFNVQLHSSEIVTEYSKLVAYLDKNLKNEGKV